MSELNLQYPVIKQNKFIKKVLKVFCLKVISTPPIFRQIHRLFNYLGWDIDQVLSNSVKGFPGEQLIEQIRQHPPSKMLHLLKLQLHSKEKSIIFDQQKNAQQLLKKLRKPSCLISHLNGNNFFWVLPYKIVDPQKFIKELRKHGLDASERSSQMCQITSEGEYFQPLERVVYLPINQYLTEEKLSLMAELINQQTEN